MKAINRRDMVKGMLRLGVACGLPFGSVAASQARRILVVGAGLSGLYAAKILEQFGYSVQIVEGRERVGGRVCTLDDVIGRPECGANLLGPNYGRLLNLAQQLKITLRQPAATLPFDYSIDGHRLSADKWGTWGQNPLPSALKHLTPDHIASHFLSDNPLVRSSDWRDPMQSGLDVSALEYFMRRGLYTRAIDLIDINNSYGNTLKNTSILSLFRTQKNRSRAISMQQPVWEVALGNMRLPEAMAGSLSSSVELGQKITGVQRVAGVIRAETEKGRHYEADGIILALPVGAVREIDFTPSLDKTQRHALTEIAYHKVTQVHLLAHEPFWERDEMSASCWTNGPLGRIFTRPSMDGQSYNITIWINGDACDQFDCLPASEATEKILKYFYALYPSARDHVSFQKLVQWQNDRFSQGAWAIWEPGQIERFADILQRPTGNIFFAGEHTAYANSGMEGAAESGERAAMQAMRALL